MLESLQTFGKGVGRELARAWEHLSDGWRELLTRSSNALTRFSHKDAQSGADEAESGAPSWGLLAGDVADDGKHIVVRVELPGIERGDCEIVVHGSTLFVTGEKRFDRDFVGGSYYVRQCAYGSFQRVIALPHPVDPARAEATYRSGVLTVKLPKTAGATPRSIAIR